MKKQLFRKNLFIQDLIRNRILWLMIAPAIIFFVLMNYLPMLGNIIAFKDYSARLGILKSPWVGLDNFKFLVKSGTLFLITRNTLLYNFVFIILGNLLEAFTAILLSEIIFKRFKKISQSVMILPHFVSFVIISVFVYNLFNYEYGLVNTILQKMGNEPIDIYSITGIWKYIIVFFQSWKHLGYGSVVYLATITSIDTTLYEAAEVDGAKTIQKVIHITIPMLKPTTIILMLLAVGRIMRGQFDLFYNIIGGNSQLYPSTDIIDTYVFRALTEVFDPGMGAAAGFYQSVFGLIFILLTNFVVKKIQKEYALF